MGYTELLTGNGLTVEQWEASIFSEFIGQLSWKNFMGTTIDSPIQVKDDLTKKVGDALTIGMRGRIVGGQVTGASKGIGNEGLLSFFNQRITIDNVRRLVKFEDVPMSNQRGMFNILNEGRQALEEEFAVDLDDDITTAIVDTASGRVQGRYLYGAVDSNWDATHATGLTNIDNTVDQLTTKMLSVAKRKALIPVNALVKIRPMKVVNNNLKNMEQWYCFKGHPLSVRDLTENDASWINKHLNIPPQADASSPLYTGSTFKGAHDGILIYEYDRLPLVASTIQVSHNVLLGAQAAAVVWGQRAKFGEEEEDLGHDRIYELHEIRGVSKLVFNRSTPEDNGVVHVFAAAVAD